MGIISVIPIPVIQSSLHRIQFSPFPQLSPGKNKKPFPEASIYKESQKNMTTML